MRAVKLAANASLIGLSGIVVQETENTVTVVTPKSAAKGASRSLVARSAAHPLAVLPKIGTVFTFSLPLDGSRSLAFDLSGTQFAHRSADRVGRKFKARPAGDFAPWDVLGRSFQP